MVCYGICPYHLDVLGVLFQVNQLNDLLSTNQHVEGGAVAQLMFTNTLNTISGD